MKEPWLGSTDLHLEHEARPSGPGRFGHLLEVLIIELSLGDAEELRSGRLGRGRGAPATGPSAGER